MDQNNMNYGAWDLSCLKNQSKNHQIKVLDRTHVSVVGSNAGASKHLVDGAIDMSGRVPSVNKVSVIKSGLDARHKLQSTPTKQITLRNYSRNKEKVENKSSPVRTSPENNRQHSMSGDLQFKMFGSEVSKKDTSHSSNCFNSPEILAINSTGAHQHLHFDSQLLQNLGKNSSTNNHQQHQSQQQRLHHKQKQPVFYDPVSTYQKSFVRNNSSEDTYQLESTALNLRVNQDGRAWNMVKNATSSSNSENANKSSSLKNCHTAQEIMGDSRNVDNGVDPHYCLNAVRSDIAMNSNDVAKLSNDFIDNEEEERPEIYSISDDESSQDSRIQQGLLVSTQEIVSASLEAKPRLDLKLRKMPGNDPIEEVYFICDDDNENEEIEYVDEDVEEIQEDVDNGEEDDGNGEENVDNDEEDVDNGEEDDGNDEDGDNDEEEHNGEFDGNDDSSHEEQKELVARNEGRRSPRIKGRTITHNGDISLGNEEEEASDNEEINSTDTNTRPRRRASEANMLLSTRSRSRRGRRPRNSLLSQCRGSMSRDVGDSDSSRMLSSFPGRRRGRGRGVRRGTSSRGGRGASNSGRSRPVKRGSSARMAADGEEDSRKAKKPKTSNMLIADKITSAVAAATAVGTSSLLEYQWPRGRNGEWFVLQEHISDFLGIVSFKRKYPEISRRAIEYQERLFLVEQGCVTEMQCDLGLTVLKADEVLDLMARDYPEKYQEYARVNRRKLKAVEKPAQNSNEGVKNDQKVVTSKADSLLKRAIKSAAEFNSSLLREKRCERQTYFDLQTFEIHQPVKRLPVKYSNVKLCDSYPVALVPGQFQEYYKWYSPEELKYFPINTALYAPHRVMTSIYADPVETASDEEEERNKNINNTNSSNANVNNSATPVSHNSMVASTSRSNRTRTPALHKFADRSELEKPDLNGSDSNMSFSSVKKARRGGTASGKSKKAIAQLSKCGMCSQTNRNKYNEPDELVKCSTCAVLNHPGCLGLSREMIPMIKTYNWQCMECKICYKCTEPHDEEKMMFCDHCDRGYHTYCVGLDAIPEGRWDCSLCSGGILGFSPPTPNRQGAVSFTASASTPSVTPAPPKPKRGRPFKYPRDANNVRILPTPSKSSTVSQSAASTDETSEKVTADATSLTDINHFTPSKTTVITSGTESFISTSEDLTEQIVVDSTNESAATATSILSNIMSQQVSNGVDVSSAEIQQGASSSENLLQT